jgi:penicillin-binding protein 1B
VTKEGKPIGHYPLQIRQAFPEAPVYLLNWALERVARYGTAASAYSILPPDLRIAGKTGTTNDMRDSWFSGFSGNRVAVVWLGRDDNLPSRFTGGSGALQLWAPIMRDIKPQSFAPVQPDDVEAFPFDPEDDSHDDNDCGSSVMVPFVRGSLPEGFEPCDTWPEGTQPPPGYEERHGRESDEEREDRPRKKRHRENIFDKLWDIFR